MRKKIFRIAKEDTIRSYVVDENKILASDYNSGYTTVSEIINVLNRKIPHYVGIKLCYTIVNTDKEISKTIIKKVNKL